VILVGFLAAVPPPTRGLFTNDMTAAASTHTGEVTGMDLVRDGVSLRGDAQTVFAFIEARKPPLVAP